MNFQLNTFSTEVSILKGMLKECHTKSMHHILKSIFQKTPAKLYAMLNNQDNGKIENLWTSKDTYFPLQSDRNFRASSGVGGLNIFTMLVQ